MLKKDCHTNDYFYKLYKKFCPGPITFVLKLKKNSNISKNVTNNKKTLAVRFPRKSIIKKLLKKLNYPLAAPSANISKNISPKLDITALVRDNSEKEFLENDLRAVTQKNIYGIALPMAESVDQVKFVDEIISDEEKKKGLEKNSIKLLLLIETALGVIKCFDICSAAERVESIVFGSA